MLTGPPYMLDAASEAAFVAALAARDGALPHALPRWTFLEWLTRQGFLLHGSLNADIDTFEPRMPNDRSPDDFSKRTAVFAASDGLWAMMYALTNRAKVKRILNMALQIQEDVGWSDMRYFLSLAPKDPAVTDGQSLLTAGSVYVLPHAGFEQMPVYSWPGLGEVWEPHWASARAVRPVMRVPVTPDDFPLPVRVHDAVRVDALAASDPWGFPWLEP